MFGWDEGPTFYNGQAQFPRGDPDHDTLTRHSTLRKFKEFIRNFNGIKGDFPYREGLVHNPKFLSVTIEDIDSFDGELSEKVQKSPVDFLPLVPGSVAHGLGAQFWLFSCGFSWYLAWSWDFSWALLLCVKGSVRKVTPCGLLSAWCWFLPWSWLGV